MINRLLVVITIIGTTLFGFTANANASLTDCSSWYSGGRAKATCNAFGSGAAGKVRAILVGKRNGVAIICGTGPWVSILEISITTTGCGSGTTPWFTSYQKS